MRNGNCRDQAVWADPMGASEVWGILFVSLAAGSGKKITIRTTDKVGVTGMGQNTGFRCMQARPTEKADRRSGRCIGGVAHSLCEFSSRLRRNKQWACSGACATGPFWGVRDRLPYLDFSSVWNLISRKICLPQYPLFLEILLEIWPYFYH